MAQLAIPAPRRHPRRIPLLVLTLVFSACGGDTDASAAMGDDGVTATADGQVMVDNLLAQEATVREKLEALAEAIPEADYGWRPMEGVRSVGEVFIHVAADNYLLPAILGVEAPPETGITTDYATVQAYEAQELTKAEVVANLAASFDHLEAGIAATRDDLGASATAFGRDFTAGGLWTMAVTHLHEHLGQAIAYARSNEVVPPWSR